MWGWALLAVAVVCFAGNLLFSRDEPGSYDFGWLAGVGVVCGALGLLEVL